MFKFVYFNTIFLECTVYAHMHKNTCIQMGLSSSGLVIMFPQLKCKSSIIETLTEIRSHGAL